MISSHLSELRQLQMKTAVRLLMCVFLDKLFREKSLKQFAHGSTQTFEVLSRMRKLGVFWWRVD